MARNNDGFDTQKLAVGEVVKFEDYTTCECDTRFGVAKKVFFADANGEIFRETFAQGGMLEWLEKNPTAKSLRLKKKLVKGDLTFNVWDAGV